MRIHSSMHENRSRLPWKYVGIPAVLAGVLYLNTLPAAFVYDDNRAILTNPDVLEKTPLVSIFYNDFWGTPLNHPGSHKSYRPLCVLTFRLNHMIGQLNPTGYHVINVVLHSVVSALLVTSVWRIVPRRGVALVSGLLFASHSIHTEAVAGVVGRAELLSALFFLLALNCFISYRSSAQSISGSSEKTFVISNSQNSCKIQNGNGSVGLCSAIYGVHEGRRCLYLVGFIFFSVMAMLSKEQGITVCGVAAVWSVLCHIQSINRGWTAWKKIKHALSESLIAACSVATLLGFFRFHIMQFQQPEFSSADNPAASSEDLLTRILTFLYLPSFNFYLLLMPMKLSFDWSMSSIPLVESFTDYRFYIVVLFYTFLVIIASVMWLSLLLVYFKHPRDYKHNYNESHNRSHKSISTTNDDSLMLHEPICKYNGTDCNVSGYKSCKQNVSQDLTLRHSSDLSPNGKPSILRNDYVSNSYLFNCNITTSIDPHASDLLSSNSGSSSKSSLNPASHDCNHSPYSVKNAPLVSVIMALALLVIPFIPSTNLFFYVGFVVAERVLYIPSMGHCLLVSLGFDALYTTARGSRVIRASLSVLIISLVVCLSWRTVRRNNDWLSEYNLYLSGVNSNPSKAWGNLANILRGEGRLKQAEEAYTQALHYRSNMADVHYNLGILYQNSERLEEALLSYSNAIKCRPNLSPALLNLGLVYVSLGKLGKAEEVFRVCNRTRTDDTKDPRLHEHTKISCLYHLGRMLSDSERVQEAVSVYNEAVGRLVPDFPAHSLYNMLGETYVKLNQLSEAESYYKLSLQLKPDHIPAHLTMARLLHQTNEDRLAEEWFQKAERLDPNDENVHQFYGFFLGELGRYDEAAEYYLKAAQTLSDNFQVISNAANMLRESGRSHEAEEYYMKAVSLKPKDIAGVINLGAILHYNGKLSEADIVYTEGLQLNPNDPTLITNLAKLRRLLAKSRKNK